MKIWILIFSAALFAGGTCLGVALQPKIAAPAPVAPKAVPEMPWESHRSPQFSVTRFREELKLSDEQDRELDAILSESQEEMQALGRAMRSAQDKSRENLVKILTLSDEQVDKLRSVLAEGRSRRHEYKPGADWRQNRKEARELQNKAIEKLLTPEQFKRYLDVSELDRYER